MLSEAVRLETVHVGADGGEAEVLESEFLGAGTDFAAGGRVGAAGGGVEAAADVPGGAGVLGKQAVTRAVETAVGRDLVLGGEGGGGGSG